MDPHLLTYSGGLGVLAANVLRSLTDLRISAIGVCSGATTGLT